MLPSRNHFVAKWYFENLAKHKTNLKQGTKKW
jgi:hypothetical protein